MKFTLSGFVLVTLFLLFTLAFFKVIGVYRHVKKNSRKVSFPKSDTVILHLGGCVSRIEKTLELAAAHPDAVIVISSEGSIARVINRLEAAGVARDRYILDFKAWDTVTNFALTFDLIKN